MAILCSVLTRTRMLSVALALLILTAAATPGFAPEFEVWLVDQTIYKNPSFLAM